MFDLSTDEHQSDGNIGVKKKREKREAGREREGRGRERGGGEGERANTLRGRDAGKKRARLD